MPRPQPIDSFTRCSDGSRIFQTPGPLNQSYLVIVASLNSAWCWSLWINGKAVDGMRGWRMTAYEACDLGLKALTERVRVDRARAKIAEAFCESKSEENPDRKENDR